MYLGEFLRLYVCVVELYVMDGQSAVELGWVMYVIFLAASMKDVIVVSLRFFVVVECCCRSVCFLVIVG